MKAPRADHVVCGRVLAAATPSGLQVVEAVGIAMGRVVSAGTRREVTDAAARNARVTDAGRAAVVPGLHDSHLHLAALARARTQVSLDGAADGVEVIARLTSALGTHRPTEWVIGRGWSDAQFATLDPGQLDEAMGERLGFLASHDGHSAWASRAALRLGGIHGGLDDPAGGRIERDASGEPTGILREAAIDLVAGLVPETRGEALAPALEAILREMAALGICGATEAGDYTAGAGTGPYAALGDSFSTLAGLAGSIDGRLRLNIGFPAGAISNAAQLGLRTGDPLGQWATLRAGWAKVYADGALGSGTAALHEPADCGRRDAGILRVPREQLTRLAVLARPAGIGLAVHAIGDRAITTVLDGLAASPTRAAGVPSDRVEHVQLLRADDAPRFASLGVVASIQPVHAAVDRDMVEACWGGRQDRAYAWRTLVNGGAGLVAGSDAPVESVNPWLGMFAALHRRLPADGRPDWRAGEALTLPEALAAYMTAPAQLIGATDEGHLRPGARADLAVLDTDLDVLLAADERLAGVRSNLTLVDGRETPLG
ncbi:MAG: amidohydrolase [Chloroflexi bacterium]|nr:amidohydrolase [Chloroflexota bacterium]